MGKKYFSELTEFIFELSEYTHTYCVLWIQHVFLYRDAGEDEGDLDFSALLKAAKK